jgi:ATP-dependent exoDNAse (exonuclease V) beta subunit
MQLKIISAGAGSGKTYRLTQEMVGMLTAEENPVRASGIIATTFTKKAAGELQERVRVKLLELGMFNEANQLANALIGTVHSVGVNLLKRFAFEAGVSPEVDIMADEDSQMMFNQSMAAILTLEKMEEMERLVTRLGMNKTRDFDWRVDVKKITEVARSNAMDSRALEWSKKQSWETFKELLPEALMTEKDLSASLKEILLNTITTLENNEDKTKTTQSAVAELQLVLNSLNSRGFLLWYEWVKIGKTKVGAKSRDDFESLANFVSDHEKTVEFHQDIKAYGDQIFNLAAEALDEFSRYKKERGLIDYTDMETLVNDLLDNPTIKEVLASEIDLLMVDEFQDTSPIQLEIFLKLSKLANQSIWVGDPKQSIYGFRGAAPELMQAIVDWAGGIQPENILGKSWRSREDVVYATNAIFTKAFPDIPIDQVALEPVRTSDVESSLMEPGLIHYHMQLDPEAGRMPGAPWFENATAEMLKRDLEKGIYITPKGSTEPRLAKPGDVAILCRTNSQCQAMAEALHRTGLKAAISRTGLLETAEAKYILACLKFLLNKYDSLSVAEILVLGEGWSTEQIIEHRLEYIDRQSDEEKWGEWAAEVPLLGQLNALRKTMQEFSSSEILDVLLEELQIRRKAMEWGNAAQRLNNIDTFCQMALQYEEGCNRLHLAASLGGFLLWLDGQARKGVDMQGSGVGPEAVNVLTYHKSKGLEYPITICHSLEGELKGDAWGISIVAEQEEVDLDNLLGNRWIRFWVNPYGDQIKGTALMERLDVSEAQQLARRNAASEDARLLYVGITRGRDYLIFPSRQGKAAKWLNRVWNGEDEQAALDPTIDETPWEWNSKVLHIQNKLEVFGREFGHAEWKDANFTYLESPLGRAEHVSQYWNPMEEPVLVKADLIEKSTWSVANVWPENLMPDEKTSLFEVLKAVVGATWNGLKDQEKLERTEGLLRRFGLYGVIPSNEVLKYKNEFQKKFLENQGLEVILDYPVYLDYQGRIFEEKLPILVSGTDGITIICHVKVSSENLAKLLKEYSSWSFFVSTFFKKTIGKDTVNLVLHFPLEHKALTHQIVV